MVGGERGIIVITRISYYLALRKYYSDNVLIYCFSTIRDAEWLLTHNRCYVLGFKASTYNRKRVTRRKRFNGRTRMCVCIINGQSLWVEVPTANFFFFFLPLSGCVKRLVDSVCVRVCVV